MPLQKMQGDVPENEKEKSGEVSYVTSHAKTYTNGFPLNGGNARLSNG